MDTEEIRSSPESQEARGLTPDEQRAERERESRETDESKYELAAEQTAEDAEEAAERIGQPLEPRED
jgi:hypothetical protein